MFGKQVQSYTSLDELRVLLDPTSQAWPDEAALARSAEEIARRHSFDERARRLLDDALAVRKKRRV